MPRKLDAQLSGKYSMFRVLSTSSMKSPPLLDCVTGSLTFGGGIVSATRLGSGTARRAWAPAVTGAAVAVATGVSAAAPASDAPLRKLRRPTPDGLTDEERDFDIISSPLSGRPLHRRPSALHYSSKSPAAP